MDILSKYYIFDCAIIIKNFLYRLNLTIGKKLQGDFSSEDNSMTQTRWATTREFTIKHYLTGINNY